VWGKFRRGVEAADAEVLASLANYDEVLVSLVAEVSSTYVLLRSLEERLAIARSNAVLQKETLDLTKIRFDAGAVSELDVTTAQATLSNTQALIPFFENAIRETTLVLCVLLGRPPSTLDELLAPPTGEKPRVPEAPPQIAAGIPADLLRRRPDVRAAERIAAAESARIGAAETELLPRISIAGLTGFASSNYDGLRTPELGNIFDGDSFQGFIGLEINWPILNYGRIIGAVRAQDAVYEQAAATYQDSVLRAASEVEAGLSRFLRSRERRDRLAESVVAAKRSVEISLIQYRAGAVDFIRVNDAQTVQLQQEDLLVDARASIALGAIAAFRGMGGGWEIRGDAELVDRETIERMRNTVNWGDVTSPDWSRGSDFGFRRPRSDLEGPEAPKRETAAPVPATNGGTQ
ncbi:MAG: TolC family protein, partial [Phycisphaerae bacterium]|nr:TolC family protein [Phycisphaerae bacterium]